MRIHPRLRTVALSAVAASGALTLLAAARPAAAQTNLPSPSEKTPIVTVRGGVYFPFNANLKNASGKTFYGGGLDYIIQQKTAQSRTIVSVDYIERSSGGTNVRITPVTIGSFTLQTGQNGIRPYAGLGVGAYFIHQNLPNSVAVNEVTDKVTIGAYFGAGLDLPGNVMVEARYHFIPRVGVYNSSGLQVMAGVRF